MTEKNHHHDKQTRYSDVMGINRVAFPWYVGVLAAIIILRWTPLAGAEEVSNLLLKPTAVFLGFSAVLYVLGFYKSPVTKLTAVLKRGIGKVKKAESNIKATAKLRTDIPTALFVLLIVAFLVIYLVIQALTVFDYIKTDLTKIWQQASFFLFFVGVLLVIAISGQDGDKRISRRLSMPTTLTASLLGSGVVVLVFYDLQREYLWIIGGLVFLLVVTAIRVADSMSIGARKEKS